MKRNFQTDKERVLDLSVQRNEPEWFLDERLKALEAADKVKPKKIERLNPDDWKLWAVPDPEGTTASLATQHKHEAYVFTYEEATKKLTEVFKAAYAQSHFTKMNDLFNAYTLAFLTSGVFIYIPDNTIVEEPILLNNWLNQAANPISNHQVLVYAGKNAAVKVIEKYGNTDTQKEGTAHIGVDILGQAGASVEYVAFDQLNEWTTAYFQRTGQTKKDTQINWTIGALNNGQAIEDLKTNLKGQGSTSNVNAVAISDHQQTQALNTHIINHGPNTLGNIFQHGVVLEQASLIFNGIGQIMKHAKNSEAQQESRILMLSDEARADANPILLIDEYEVQAGHAASISRVNQDQLYYLMSRGLSQTQAEKLVIRGFLGIVLAGIPDQNTRNAFFKTIERIF